MLADRARRPRARRAAPRPRRRSSASPRALLIALVALAITFNLDTSLQTALPGYTSALQTARERRAPPSAARCSARRRADARSSRRRRPRHPSPRRARAQAPADPRRRAADHRRRRLVQLAAARRSPSLRGKVVLLDFWTYSCINCLRTLPHLEAWYADLPPLRARDHRRPQPRVRLRARRLERRGRDQAARHPLPGRPGQQLRDLERTTRNEYWPADYLIDQQGRIRALLPGEGDYGEIETDIQQLLGVSSADDGRARPDPDRAT